MAHFAEINPDGGQVLRVIVVKNDDCNNLQFPASEPVGQSYIASIGIPGEFRQTSYSGSFRGKYASEYDIYDPIDDVFRPLRGE